MRSFNSALGATALAALLASPSARAQATDNAASETDQVGPAAQIETVTVTARRRVEDLEKVPLNVTVLSGDMLRNSEVKTATDLQTVSPTLIVAGNLGSRDDAVFSIRGQGQTFGGADPGVQSYFDEVPFNAAGPGTFYDMAKIQVLSGPQGTLFGRSTTGGAVLFTPEKPQEEFGGNIDGQYGNYDFKEIEGALNVPIAGDTLLARAAFDVAARNGFTKDIVETGGTPYVVDQDNLNYQSFRVGVTWRPFSHLENYALFNFWYSHTHGTGDVLTGIASESAMTNIADEQLVPLYVTQYCAAKVPNCTAQGTAAGSAAAAGFVGAYYPLFQAALAEQQSLGDRMAMSSILPLYRRQTWIGIDIAQYDISPDITLRNIFGYLDDKKQSAFNYDGTYLPLLAIPAVSAWESDSIQVTDEIQVVGETGDKSIDWIGGFYHELDHPGGYSSVEREIFGGGDINTPLSSTEVGELANGGTSNAVYGSATYNAPSWAQGLSLTAGGRYTWDYKVATNLSCTYAVSQPPPENSPCPSPLTNAYIQPTLSGHFAAPNWTLSANYQATNDIMVYATYRRGYKSGGFNSGVAPDSGYAAFQPEYLTDVEAGSKNDWTILGTPGRTNFDAYYGWYENVQKNDLIDVNLVPSALTLNAARAHIEGIDFQSTIVPNEHLDVTAFYSYTQARYDSFIMPTAIVGTTEIGLLNHAGNPFAYTPAQKIGVTANLHFMVMRDIGIPTFSLSWYHQSREWFTDLSDLEPGGSQGDYNLFNLRLDWDRFLRQPADFAFFANNVTDVVYKVGGNPIEHLIGTDSSIFGAPRMFGIELRYRFGEDSNAQ